MSGFVKNIAAWAATAAMLLGVPLVSPQPALAGFKQQGDMLVAPGPATTTFSEGRAVALSADGNTAIVGGADDKFRTGSVWFFTRANGVWNQQGPRVIGSGATGYAYQGLAVALSADGNTAIVGGPGDNGDVGAAWVFTRSKGIWKQQGPKLVGTSVSGIPEQGRSVALSADGNTAMVGGPNDGGGRHGAAWMFTRSNGTWTQQGPKLVGTGARGYALLGTSVALSADGNTAIVGGPYDGAYSVYDGAGDGAAWVFTRSNGIWKQQGPKLVGTGAVGSADQGNSVALSADGNTAIVGGPNDNQILGATWVFTRSNGVWAQQGPKLVGTGLTKSNRQAQQGQYVAASGDGNTALVSGPFDDAAWVFTRSKGVWTQQGRKFAGTDQAAMGQVALSTDGSTALIGGDVAKSYKGAAWVFVAAPTVTGVNPMTGPAAGGTSVTITGTNFTGATAVKFGTIDAASFTVRNATTIVARTPKHPVGAVKSS